MCSVKRCCLIKFQQSGNPEHPGLTNRDILHDLYIAQHLLKVLGGYESSRALIPILSLCGQLPNSQGGEAGNDFNIETSYPF